MRLTDEQKRAALAALAAPASLVRIGDQWGVDRATVWWTADCAAARRGEIGALLRAEADHA